ncbi:unnamed protein product [Pleuronectes platessa]|uniref:Uncharacterized protein n=1 Tax=Pleuronectes platessa TaxID=8262 RepID=A0A9N7Y4R0_PLEPL|nr:unnamed protein product [Pleuronectes platessa]
MGFLQSQNLTLSLTQPEVIRWESTSELSSSVNNILIILGVLTFAIQLCLLLGFLLRFSRFDNKVAEALKHSDTADKLVVPSTVYPDSYKEASYHLYDYDPAAVSMHVVSSREDTYEQHETSGSSLFAPFIPWDIAQQ